MLRVCVREVKSLLWEVVFHLTVLLLGTFFAVRSKKSLTIALLGAFLVPNEHPRTD